MGYIAAILIGIGALAFVFYVTIVVRTIWNPGIDFRWRLTGAVAVSMAFVFGGIGWLFTQESGAMGLPLVLPLAIGAGIVTSWNLLTTKAPKQTQLRRPDQK